MSFFVGFTDELLKLAFEDQTYRAKGTHVPSRYRGAQYSVSKLWELAKKLPAERLAVEDAQDYLRPRRAWTGGKSPLEILKSKDDSHGHMTRIRQANLRHPIIMAPHGGMADGMHRIAKATMKGKDTVRLKRFMSWEEMEPARIKR